MGQFVPRQFEQILETMINRVVARTTLTDINDGSSLKQVLAAAAREDDQLYYQMINLLDLFDIRKARGTDLDERAKEYNPALLSRNQARRATGEVIFSRAGTAGTVTIPIGTQVQVPAQGGSAAIVFSTIEVGTISAGNTDSNNVDIEADEAGTEGNVAVGTITGFVSKPSGVDSVTNPASLVNGTDLESDDEFRNRLLAQVRGLARSHVFGLESAALGVEDTSTGKRVVFAQVVEDVANRGDVVVYIDDGAGTAEDPPVTLTGQSIIASAVGGEVDIYLPAGTIPVDTSQPYVFRVNATPLVEDTDYNLNPASGHIKLTETYNSGNGLNATDAVDGDWTHFVGLIAEVQKVIDGDPSDRVNYPGYRAAGVLVRVLAPNIVQLVVTCNVTVQQGYNVPDVIAQVEAALSTYVNGLGISDDVILNELRERAMAVPGMFDVSFLAPTENRVILDNQLARLVASNLTVS